MRTMFKLAFLLLVFGCVSITHAQELKRIEVVGTGEVLAVPDVFHVSLSVTERGPVIPKMSTIVDSNVSRIVAFLEQHDIPKQDIKASVVELHPIFNNRTLENDEQSYQLSRRVEFVIRDFDKYALLLHGIIERGATSINSFSSGLTNQKALYRQALNLALKDAVHQAQQIAKQLNVELGEVILVQEGANQYASPLAARSFKAESSAGYQSGTSTVSANIQLIYSIDE